MPKFTSIIFFSFSDTWLKTVLPCSTEMIMCYQKVNVSLHDKFVLCPIPPSPALIELMSCLPPDILELTFLSKLVLKLNRGLQVHCKSNFTHLCLF